MQSAVCASKSVNKCDNEIYITQILKHSQMRKIQYQLYSDGGIQQDGSDNSETTNQLKRLKSAK